MLNKLQRKVVYRAPILGSSSDEEKISLTVKGLLLALVAVLASVGVNTQELELNTLVEAILNLTELGVQAVASISIIVGIARKIYNKFKK